MRPHHWAAALVAAATALAYSSTASAFTWIEHNAGDTPATAEITGPLVPLDGITGFLDATTPVNGTPIYQVDLFKIHINDFSSFSARTVSAGPDDTALFLFNSGGFGVYMNDDNGLDLLSTLPAGNAFGPAANGYYYLGVGIGGMAAKDGASMDVFNLGSFSDVLAGAPGSGPLASWVQGFPAFSETSLAYRIELTGAVGAVPEPSTMLMLCTGLLGLASAVRKRRQLSA